MFDFHLASRSSTEDDASQFPAFIHKEEYRDLLAKWGFLQPGEWSLQRYQYSFAERAPLANEVAAGGTMPGCGVPAASADGARLPAKAAANSPSPVTAAALRFHHGMAKDFLRSLFSSSLVRSHLKGAVGDERATLRFRPLTCSWTTLQPLRQALVDAKVVRQVRPVMDNADASERNPHGGGGDEDCFRLPTVKCAEELLPHGEMISDELRALFLQAHQRSCSGVGHSSAAFDTQSEEAESGSYADEDDDGWGVMAGAKLPLRQLRRVFDKSARGELLYHLLWRLIAGSGPLNQFEDDAAAYFDVARQLYRSLVTSFHVREVAVLGRNSESVDDDVAALESPNEPPSTTRYEAVIDALVYEVSSAPGLRLFPASDGVAPSNLNYCYVVVSAMEQTVCVWYHHC
ncbi:hypothetical protein ABB37_06006 [Leptomonas pyrrhocoris]|uniref:Cilia- and flagella-associated protein 300 n=1 Tax=Leptomonas pyrrhocoris TaxID=157538 RepID=A0A0N0DUH5_LEPPY|nr:hypothetical protein ABB37_06006 [Leptomonas pyrrhocoris]KPA78942.1 hypothetical protein ABB37_06006 [Leptomonas pyrrhocoris]|eukprot:XP_015657381.1 hypothetical protein ABB37_06006 [Leptomonas pyrrhocoris]